MRREPDAIPYERLMSAVDAIFEAGVELGLGALPDDPVGLLGSSDQPCVFCDYTRPELEAATAFLVRMGLLPRRDH